MNREFNGFDEMVEALEENEDMVECKECFDLVPKVDCERAEVGYICPTCKGLRTAPAQARFVDPYDSYTQDFPEVTEYDPDSVVEYEKEPGLGDALADLIKDEYEAIDGYEVADETIQHAAIDEDEKDEILDTLDHIKEEEEEHIDELKELCPECDPVAEPETESVAEPEVEPEKLEEAADDKVADEVDSAVREKLDIDLSNCIESSDMEIWGVEPVGEGTYKAVLLKRFENVSFRGNDEIDKVESEMFDLGGLFVFYFGKNGMPELDRWDPELLRSLNNCEIIFEDDRYDQACERTFNRSTSQTEGLEEAANEEEVEEIPEEETKEEAENSEENENEEVSDLDSAYEAALEIANEIGVGQVFGYARKDTEEFVAIEPFEVDDPDAVEDDLMAVYDDVAYAYVAYPEKELKEALFESVQLNEGIFDKSAKIFNAIAAKGFEVVASPVPADNANAKLKSGQKFNKGEYDKAKKFAQMASSITKTSIWGIKIIEPEAALKAAGLTDASLLNLLKENKNILTIYKAGKETVNNKTFLKDLDTILKSHKMASKLGIADAATSRDAFETSTETEAPAETASKEAETVTEPVTEPETEPKPEAAPEATPKADTDAPEAVENNVKLSDLSDEQLETLAKIFGNRKPDVIKNTVNKLRAAFTKLGESVESPEAVLKALEDNATDLKDTAQALKDVQQSLKEDETCTKTMIREEYHKYANPAEITAMENLQADVDKIVNQVVTDLVAAGYDDLDYYDSDCYMSGNNACTITMFIGSNDTFEAGETEDLQDHMANQVEEALAQIKLPPEIVKIQGGVLFPDDLIMDEDDAADGVTRGEITVDVTFARNLI